MASLSWTSADRLCDDVITPSSVALVTGFGPFGVHSVNASWEAVKTLENAVLLVDEVVGFCAWGCCADVAVEGWGARCGVERGRIRLMCGAITSACAGAIVTCQQSVSIHAVPCSPRVGGGGVVRSLSLRAELVCVVDVA